MVSSKTFRLHRQLSSASIFHAVKKVEPLTPLKHGFQKNKPSYPPTKASPATTSPIYQTFESTLAERARPTILYQAPSHTTFMISSYGAGTFCLMYAAVSFWANYLEAPADLPYWVPVAYGSISFGMAAFGGWLILGPARIVRTITAIPQSVSRVSGSVSSKLIKAGQSELKIEVELRKMLPVPFWPARKLYAKPGQVVLPSSLGPVNRRPSMAEMRLQRHQEEVAKQKALEYEKSHIMSAGIRHMSRAIFSILRSIGRAWSREGFMKLDVKGQFYKLDVTGGWALDGGKALDRLAVIKPKI